MNPFYQSTFLEALGWSLIDSLWQMGLLWMGYTATTLNGNRYTSAKRFSLALIAVAAGGLWFLGQFRIKLL